MCRSMVDIQSAAAEIRRGIKKRKAAINIMVALLHRATTIMSAGTWGCAQTVGATSSAVLWFTDDDDDDDDGY